MRETWIFIQQANHNPLLPHLLATSHEVGFHSQAGSTFLSCGTSKVPPIEKPHQSHNVWQRIWGTVGVPHSERMSSLVAVWIPCGHKDRQAALHPCSATGGTSWTYKWKHLAFLPRLDQTHTRASLQGVPLSKFAKAPPQPTWNWREALQM